MAGVSFISGTMDLDTAIDMNVEQMDSSKMSMKGNVDMAVQPALAEELDMPDEEAKFQSAIEYYYTDGWYYMNMMDTKIKMPLSFEDILSQTMNLTTTSSEPISLLKDISKSSSTYTIVYDGAAMTGLTGQVLGVMGTTGVAGDAASLVPDMTFPDTTITVTIQNGHMTDMTTQLSMEMDMDGLTMSIDMDLKVTDIRYGGNVNVTLPSDLSSYQDLSTELPAA